MIFSVDPSEALARARDIRLLLLDVDGVLTAGELYLADSGEEIKAFSTLDGQGIKLLQNAGVEVGILSGRTSALLARRAANLGISLLIQGREDKRTALEELCTARGLQTDTMAYVGDDLPDIRVMKAVRLGFAVANAHAAVKQVAHAITDLQGGHGAVREVCDFILQAQDKYDAAVAPFL
jgi:3-deoxy-D-manno-octulosonate 8-phosphate phosphatase (KDO 8-P phosphatase)